MSAIVGPIAPYNNLPIEEDNYAPRTFFIADITFGQTTTVTTTEDHDFVIGQLVRLLIPSPYGASQLNTQEAFVISLPADDQVELNIPSAGSNSFIANPYTADITDITQANPCVITADNSFKAKQIIRITDVDGMTELNDAAFTVDRASPTTITLAVNSTGFTAYTGGGIASLTTSNYELPQIIPVGDINSGNLNSSGRVGLAINIPGSFENIS